MQATIEGKRQRVIVPCFNARTELHTLLEQLSRYEDVTLKEVIVVDDGSTDGTREMLQQDFPSVDILQGDGSLLWTGAIRIGMEKALADGVDFLFWLNHDCRPDPGAFALLRETLRDPGVGCVSGYCRIAGYPEYPVNPGFKRFRPLNMHIANGELVIADGVNGNFVGFRADHVKRIGLPDAKHHPHYGDGPYTYRFSQAGLKVLVNRVAHADLGYEVLRRLPPFWRVVVSKQSVWWWLRYFFTSFKSQYHWKYRWNDSLAFRGWLAVVSYPKVELQALCGVIGGGLCRLLMKRDRILAGFKAKFSRRYPIEKLVHEIAEL